MLASFSANVRVVRLFRPLAWVLSFLVIGASVPAVAATTFGGVAYGTTSSSVPVTVTFAASGTIASVQVVTQGTLSLDFNSVAGGTCAAGVQRAAGGTCTVNVTFTPKGVGLRMGAVVLNSSTGVLGTAFVSGIGNDGLLTSYFSQTPVGTGLSNPYYLTVDAAGNVYISTASSIVKVAPNGTQSTVTVLSGANVPYGIAVDGAGNVYAVTSTAVAFAVVEVPAGGGVRTTIATGSFDGPIAVDASGNVYVANGSQLEQVIGGSGTVLATAPFSISGLTVDSAGDVYASGQSGSGSTTVSEVGELTAGSSTVVSIGSSPAPSLWQGIAVDAAGNIYVADDGNNTVVLLPAGGGAPTTLPTRSSALGGVPSGLSLPYGVALDGMGNVYIADSANNRVVELLGEPDNTETWTFGSVDIGSRVTDGLTYYNTGNIPITLGTSVQTSYFSVNSSCGAAPIPVNSTCTLDLTFAPPLTASPGNYSATLTLTDSAPPSAQSLSLQATAVLPPPTQLVFSVPPPATLISGQNAGTVTVYVESASGTLVTSPSVSITLSASSGYSQTYSANSANGIATIDLSGVALGSGTYTFTASSSGLTSATAITTVLPNNSSIPAQTVDTPSAATTVTLAFDTTATLGSIKVVTQGTTGLDFQQAATNGGTCAAGTTYFAGQTCTVNVIFTPKGVGPRMGAVQLYDNGPTPILLATAFLSGVGNGGLLNFSTSQIPIGSGLSLPHFSAVSAAGNVYISDSANNRVVEEPAGGGAQTVVTASAGGVALSSPEGLALDGLGNLYIADFHNNRIIVVSVGGAESILTPTVGGVGLNGPQGIAIDGAQNLYISDVGNNRVVEVPSSGTASTLGSGLLGPRGVAVDSAGNIFICDTGNGRVVEVPAGGGTQTVINTTANGLGLNAPVGVSVDGTGRLYIGDYGNNRIVVAFVGSGTPATIGSGLSLPFSAVADGLGNVYIADNNNNRVAVVQQTQIPPTLNLGSVAVGATPGTASLPFTNIGNVGLTLSETSAPSQFTGSDTCSGAVAINSSCALNLTFTPTTGSLPNGTIVPGTLMLTDNSPTSPQVINLTGTALLTTLTPTLQPETEVYGSPFSATVTLANMTVGTATGTITFAIPGKTLCTTATLSSGPITCNAANSGLSVGTYPVTFAYSGDSRYAPATGSGTLTVTRAPLTVTAISPSPINYGQAVPAYTANYSGFVNSDTNAVVTGSPSLTTNPVAPSAVGTYTITAALGTLSAANYTFNFVNGTLTINKATLTVTAANATRTYGAANPTFTGTVTGLLNGDTVTVTYATSAVVTSGVGPYAITPTVTANGNTNLANYTLTSTPGTLTVTAAPLTVTVSNANRVYGAANPAFTSTVNGLLNGDTVTVTYATTAVATSAPANYPITATVTASANYTVTTNLGTLTVTLGTLTLTAVPELEVSGSPVPEIVTFSGAGSGTPTGTLTFTLGGTTLCTTTANSTSISGTSITCTAAANSLAASGIPYTVSIAYSGDPNYTVQPGGTAQLTVTAPPPDVFPGQATSPIAVPVPVLPATVPPISVQFVCGAITFNGTPTSTTAAGITCNSQQFTLSSVPNSPVAVTVTTTGSTVMAFVPQRRSETSPWFAMVLPAPGFVLLGLGGWNGRRRRQQRRRWICLGVMSLLLFSVVACGGHFTPPASLQSGGSGSGSQAATTAAGVYSVTVVDEPTSCVLAGTPPANCNVTGFVQTSLIVPLVVTAPPQ